MNRIFIFIKLFTKQNYSVLFYECKYYLYAGKNNLYNFKISNEAKSFNLNLILIFFGGMFYNILIIL